MVRAHGAEADDGDSETLVTPEDLSAGTTFLFIDRGPAGCAPRREGFSYGGCDGVDVRIGEAGVHGQRQHLAGQALGDGGDGVAVAEALVEGLAVDGGGVEDGGLDAALAEFAWSCVARFTAGEDADGVLVPDVVTPGSSSG